MRRTTVALLAALEALVSALICFGIVLVPLMLLWAVHFELALGLDVVFRAAADVWLVGHGVDLTVQLDPVTAARTGAAGAEAPFEITIALLGIAFITVVTGRRIGRRAAAAGSPVIGPVAAVVVAAAAGVTAALLAGHPAATASVWQAGLLPAAIMAGGCAIGCLGDPAVRDELVDRLPGALPDRALAFGALAWRVGVGAAFAVLGVAAVVVAWAVAADYATIAGLYQTLGAGIDGGIAVTVAELLILPNLVIWAAAWLLGPGFAVGAGSQVTSSGTLLGPVPGIPLAGAVPAEGSPLSALWLVVPVLAAFLGALFVWRGADEVAVNRPRWWHPVAVGVAAGVIAGATLGLAAWWSGGAVGPGRLAEVGPDGWLVAGVAALTVAVGAVAGGFAARGGREHAQGAGGPARAEWFGRDDEVRRGDDADDRGGLADRGGRSEDSVWWSGVRERKGDVVDDLDDGDDAAREGDPTRTGRL